MKKIKSIALLTSVLLMLNSHSMGKGRASIRDSKGIDKRPVSIAWSVLINMGGKWICQEKPEVAIPAIIDSGIQYIRAAGAAGPSLEAGIPRPEVGPWIAKLKDAGVHVGVVLYLQNQAVSSRRFIEKAQVLLDSGYYDWVMLDGMRKVRPELQQIVDKLYEMGWSKVMLNVSPWSATHRKGPLKEPIPKRVWGYGTMFHSMPNKQPFDPKRNPIDPEDIAFVKKINKQFPGSLPILKFEIPWQMEKFSDLDSKIQKRLLKTWAEGQAKYGYTMIYPFFTSNMEGRGFNAIKKGLWDYECELIKTFNATRTLSTVEFRMDSQ